MPCHHVGIVAWPSRGSNLFTCWAIFNVRGRRRGQVRHRPPGGDGARVVDAGKVGEVVRLLWGRVDLKARLSALLGVRVEGVEPHVCAVL